MSKVLIEVPDEFIDWAGWTQHQLKTELGASPAEDHEAPGTTPADEPEDPWTRPTSAPPASQTASAPRSDTTEDGQPSSPPKGAYTFRAADGKVHTFNKAGAPDCDHDQPAVHVAGKSTTGKNWRQYRCALSSTERWKDKCEFSDWA
jgi:hypothetical protein